MTKQLTTATTTSATTISPSNLTPTAISPTSTVNSTASASAVASTITPTTNASTIPRTTLNTTSDNKSLPKSVNNHSNVGIIIGEAVTNVVPSTILSPTQQHKTTATRIVLPNINQTLLSPQQQKQQEDLQQHQQQKSKGHGRALNDTSGRSAALERAYVHDVYENCEEPTGPIRPRVAQFLSNLDPGSVVCDVGCGAGRYLTQCNPAICTVGVDRCVRLSKEARKKGGEVALCDNLELPFRDDSFDAVLSLAVVHHFATTERRISALRELARILRIGGRVIITVWALEQRHRRFESQDVLIPWQPPKNRNFNYSDDDDEADDFLPPYHAYTEDSTNSSRSAGDGDSSSLSSSSPGESCYSFVRRAIQKLAGGRKHPWFLDSWTSKETKNNSSLEYEDAKDLPIELRRLEDFDDFNEPPLSALKSRSLGSILNPPPRQIVRSRSSLSSFGGSLVLHGINAAAVTTLGGTVVKQNSQSAIFLSAQDVSGGGNNNINGSGLDNGQTVHGLSSTTGQGVAVITSTPCGNGSVSSLSRRPKLIKQKQSLCDEDTFQQLADNPYHLITSYNNNSQNFNSSFYSKSGCYHHYTTSTTIIGGPMSVRNIEQTSSMFLRKQSSLNEELMAGNRIREKERVRKHIQKQMSLNEAFLCRSALFSKRLHVIRESFANRIKSSTDSLERLTKHSFTKIMQNLKTSPTAHHSRSTCDQSGGDAPSDINKHCLQHHPNHHHHHHMQQQSGITGSSSSGYYNHLQHLLHRQTLLGGSSGCTVSKFAGPVIYCNSSECVVSSPTVCFCSAYHHGCMCTISGGNSSGGGSSLTSADENAEEKVRRHSRESGSDSSKDSSLQSDTSIESEDSFASVIFIPKPEQHQQQLNYQQQHQNSSSSNSSSSNGSGVNQPKVCSICSQQQLPQQHQLSCKLSCCGSQQQQYQQYQHKHKQCRNMPSVPTSPLIMPCPPTPAHSPAAAQTSVMSPPQIMAAVTAAMAIITPSCHAAIDTLKPESPPAAIVTVAPTIASNKNRFSFDEAHIAQQKRKDSREVLKQTNKTQEIITASAIMLKPNNCPNTITRQIMYQLPPIPKFRKQQSMQRQNFPIVRRSSASAGTVPGNSIPKLLSLELFNPAIDDLDSDSSEPSSPDSIDSVISAPKLASTYVPDTIGCSYKDLGKNVDEPTISTISASKFDEDKALTDGDTNFEGSKQSGNLKTNGTMLHDIIINIDDDSCDALLPIHAPSLHYQTTQDYSTFAEQLRAQLRAVEDQTNCTVECGTLEDLGISNLVEILDDRLATAGSGVGGSNLLKKRNGNSEQQRDLTTLREELRERRLMLANLSTQPSLQQSPTSSSTSSLSSQTRSFTIHEEDEDEDEEENERSYTLQLYENCKVSKFNYKRNRNYNLNPETAYLLQEDGDSSVREDEEDELDDVILEVDEETAVENISPTIVNERSIRCTNIGTAIAALKSSPVSEAFGPDSTEIQHQSVESWEHSNSSTISLDSPSQGGGSSTHHRYYHVFREGELDSLINHHVSNLHIVSSYYERASWCVVAEKVQVWTI